jgi:hypothetical protein
MTTGRINQVTVEPPKQPVALGDESATRAFRSFYPPLNSSLSHSDIESVLSPSQRQLQMGQNPSQRTASLTYAACIELGPSARTATRGQAVYDKCGTRPQSATGLNRANKHLKISHGSAYSKRYPIDEGLLSLSYACHCHCHCHNCRNCVIVIVTIVTIHVTHQPFVTNVWLLATRVLDRWTITIATL